MSEVFNAIAYAEHSTMQSRKVLAIFGYLSPTNLKGFLPPKLFLEGLFDVVITKIVFIDSRFAGVTVGMR